MRKHLNLIQFSRAIVPLFVILFHAKAFLVFYFHYNFLNLPSVVKSGGVYYFFALSGFMVYYLYHNDRGDFKKFKSFLWNRLIRIYPLYWILTVLILSLYLVFPSLNNDGTISIGHIVRSFLLLPSKEGDPILSVAWSLVHTVFFYFVFSLRFLKNKVISIVVPSVWIVVSFLFSVHFLTSEHYFMNYLFNFNNLIFISGVGCGFIVTKIRLKMQTSVLFVIIGLLGFPFSWLNTQYEYINFDFQLAITLSSVLLIIGFASIDLQRDINIPKFAKLLGNASFSIYLVHYYCMGAITLLLGYLSFIRLPNILIAISLMVVSTISGCFVYLFLEKPLNQKFKKMMKKKHSGSDVSDDVKVKVEVDGVIKM